MTSWIPDHAVLILSPALSVLHKSRANIVTSGDQVVGKQSVSGCSLLISCVYLFQTSRESVNFSRQIYREIKMLANKSTCKKNPATRWTLHETCTSFPTASHPAAVARWQKRRKSQSNIGNRKLLPCLCESVRVCVCFPSLHCAAFLRRWAERLFLHLPFCYANKWQ